MKKLSKKLFKVHYFRKRIREIRSIIREKQKAISCAPGQTMSQTRRECGAVDAKYKNELSDCEWELEQAILDRESLKTKIILALISAAAPVLVVNFKFIVEQIQVILVTLKL